MAVKGFSSTGHIYRTTNRRKPVNVSRVTTGTASRPKPTTGAATRPKPRRRGGPAPTTGTPYATRPKGPASARRTAPGTPRRLPRQATTIGHVTRKRRADSLTHAIKKAKPRGGAHPAIKGRPVVKQAKQRRKRGS